MLQLTIWGSRGSVPVSGSRFMRHGGSTTCLEIAQLEASGACAQRVIIDCGTGLVDLGHSWGERGPETLLLQTHFHWDHLDGFPFFAPFFNPGNSFEIWATPRDGMTFRQVLEDRMSGPNFPIGLDILPARLLFRDIIESGTHTVGGLQVRWAEMIHPSGSTAWRFDDLTDGSSLVFSGDCEVELGCREQLIDLARGAHTLVMDAQYFPEEYPSRRGFGHSTPADAVEVAVEAGVSHLVLTHHDAGHDDARLDAKLELANRLARGRLRVSCAFDGMRLDLPAAATRIARP